MTQTINKTEGEQKRQEARIKINIKFLKYTPAVEAYLLSKEEERI